MRAPAAAVVGVAAAPRGPGRVGRRRRLIIRLLRGRDRRRRRRGAHDRVGIIAAGCRPPGADGSHGRRDRDERQDEGCSKSRRA